MSNSKLRVHTHHVAGSVAHAVRITGVPPGKTAQVFVYSYRTHLYYPQHPFTGTVKLGDGNHEFGHYRVAVVALESTPVWTPVSVLPAGEKEETFPIYRFGIK